MESAWCIGLNASAPPNSPPNHTQTITEPGQGRELKGHNERMKHGGHNMTHACITMQRVSCQQRETCSTSTQRTTKSVNVLTFVLHGSLWSIGILSASPGMTPCTVMREALPVINTVLCGKGGLSSEEDCYAPDPSSISDLILNASGKVRKVANCVSVKQRNH
jgi:hypothetical protein